MLGLAGVVLGAALMYVLDPVAGARRRAALRQAVQAWARRGGFGVEGSREAMHRARGLVIDLASRLRQRGRPLTSEEARPS